MSIPTPGEQLAKLCEHLRLAQESAAMMAHLHNVQDSRKDSILAKGWLAVSEALKLMNHKVIELAKGRLN